VLRRILRPQREEVAGGWRSLHNEVLHNLYFSPNIIKMIKPRRMGRTGHATRLGEIKNAYRILVRETEWKLSLGRHRRRWKDDTKKDFAISLVSHMNLTL